MHGSSRARALPLGPVPIGASMTGKRVQVSVDRPFLQMSGARHLWVARREWLEVRRRAMRERRAGAS